MASFLSFWPCGLSFPIILAFWAFISLHFGLVGLHFLAFWPCGPSFPCILALRASFPCILAFSGSASGALPQVAKNGPLAQRPYNGFISAVTGSILQFLAFWAFISVHFGLVGLHFLAFWPYGPSFPCILALWAFISLHFGLLGLHFLSFWPFRGQLLGSPPQVAKNGPFAQRPYNGFISAVTGSILQFLAFWAFISLHFGLVGLHFLSFWLFVASFLSFWPCGLSFPIILAFWAFISLHFGLVGLHFLAFWPCGPSFPCILALRASFPCILAFSGSASGALPQVAKNGPLAQRPYNGFISAVTGSILQFLAFWAFISVHFGLVGLHFLVFWPYGPSFPCILALWAFISLHFGLLGLHFLSFWPFRGQLLGSPPQVAKNGPFAQRPYNGFISAVTGSILQFLAFWAFISLHFGLVGLHFLAFWPCGPSFPCILALWAFISLHFGLLGLHFLVFWPCGPSFPFILAFSGSASGVPPTSCQKWPVCPTSLQWIYQRRDRLHFAVFNLLVLLFLAFWPCGPSFPCILALSAFISLYFGLVGLPFSFSASILAFGASILPLRALRGGILSFYSLRLFEPSGGYPSQLRASDILAFRSNKPSQVRQVTPVKKNATSSKSRKPTPKNQSGYINAG